MNPKTSFCRNTIEIVGGFRVQTSNLILVLNVRQQCIFDEHKSTINACEKSENSRVWSK